MPDQLFPPPNNPAWPSEGVQSRVRGLAAALMNTLAAPGKALQSTTPIATDEMIKPAADIAMMTTLGAGAIPAEANTARMGIKAYHGSPYDFDRFDLSKIGTGEGAQAYGHGLYFAENPEVAGAYQKMLAGRTSTNILEQLAQQSLDSSLNAKEAAQSLRNRAASERRDPFSGISPEHMDRAAELLDSGWKPSKGKMYEVNINAEPHQFLDWDRPLSEQPSIIQELAKPKSDLRFGNAEKAPVKGSDVYHMVARQQPNPAFSDPLDATHIIDVAGASKQFREAGIPGIKYLDQGSRGAGQGTNNYVVFDDKLIDILRKYGLAGMAPAPAGLAAALLNKPPEGGI